MCVFSFPYSSVLVTPLAKSRKNKSIRRSSPGYGIVQAVSWELFWISPSINSHPCCLLYIPRVRITPLLLYTYIVHRSQSTHVYSSTLIFGRAKLNTLGGHLSFLHVYTHPRDNYYLSILFLVIIEYYLLSTVNTFFFSPQLNPFVINTIYLVSTYVHTYQKAGAILM